MRKGGFEQTSCVLGVGSLPKGLGEAGTGRLVKVLPVKLGRLSAGVRVKEKESCKQLTVFKMDNRCSF